ncbi:MAG: Wzz/FepE/Etk N-terminal domain-containing protein [Bacillota bacterium]|nr:Wzz/FepE/Etk N-terminal domain-containing protein [Bacillota bacterium]
MEIKEYVGILKKRFMLILIITLLCTFTSAVYSYVIAKPKYNADISVIIGKNETDKASVNNYNDLMMYQQLVKTYSAMTSSRKVIDDVIQKLNLTMSPKALQSMISVAPQGDTQFLTITVKSYEPETAQKIANQVAQSLADQSKLVMNQDNVHILDQALLPEGPSSPRPMLNMAIAFFLGLMISMGVAFLIEYLDNTVKTEEEIEKLIGIPVIGLIPVVQGEE